MKLVDIDVYWNYVKFSFEHEGNDIEITLFKSMYGPIPMEISINGKSFYTRYESEKYLKALIMNDKNKIEFMRLISELGLNGDKHTHFNPKRAIRAGKIRSTINRRVNKAYEFIFEGKPKIIDNFLIIPSRNEYYQYRKCSLLIKTISTLQDKYYTSKIDVRTLGYILDTKRIRKKDLNLKEITLEEFVVSLKNMISKGLVDIQGYEEYLPEIMML